MIAGLPRAVERVEETVDFLGAAELKHWQGIPQRLEGRLAAHGGRLAGRAAPLDYDRPGLLKDVWPEVQRALEAYDQARNARPPAGTVRRVAIAAMVLIAGGVGLGAAVLALGSWRAWLAGIPASAALVVLALLLLPAARRAALRALSAQVASLGESLLPALTRRFERELDRARERVLESTGACGRFIRSESERLGGQAQQQAALRGRLDALYERVELMR